MEINSLEEISESESSSFVGQITDNEAGIIFEENIRTPLEIYCNFVKTDLPRDIYYKKLIFNNEKVVYVIQNEPITAKINNKKYKILFGKDRSLSIKNEKGEEIINIKAKKSKDDISYLKTDREEREEIFISGYEELEIDGYYRINNFKKDMFDSNEVSILYSSLNNEEEQNYQYAVIEVELNPKSIMDLIETIRDEDRLFKALQKKVIFIGFINSSNVKPIKNNNLKDTKCVIYGINNSTFFGKNVSREIDWDLEKKFKELKNTVNALTNTVNELTNTVNELNEKIEKIFNYIKEQKTIKEKKADDYNKMTQTKKEKIPLKKEKDTKFGKKEQKEQAPKEEEKEEESEKEEEIKLKREDKKEIKKKKKEKKDEKDQLKQKEKINKGKVEEDSIITEKKGKTMKKEKEKKEIQKFSGRKRERHDINENDN